MGWFDDDDDDDEDDNVHQHQQPNQKIHGDDEEEEEDPLDAFMKSNEQQQRQDDVTTQKQNTRLDVENEDEATNHWLNDNNKQQKEDKEEEEQEGDSKKYASRKEMSLTFHRAGEKQQEEVPADDDDDLDDLIQKKKNKKIDIKLDQVQHSNIHYEKFRKSFWNSSNNNTSKGHEWRKSNNITCAPGNIDPLINFDDLHNNINTSSINSSSNEQQKEDANNKEEKETNHVNDSTISNNVSLLLEIIKKKNYIKPTLVQSQSIPIILSGYNTLVTSSTGSGKTLAYVWPMIIHVFNQRPLILEDNELGPIGLVLVPTRELALQVYKQVKIMIQPFNGATATSIIGGIPKYELIKSIKNNNYGYDIIVATPGRLLDVLSSSSPSSSTTTENNKRSSRSINSGINLLRTTYVVLDEADKMLDMGFENQVGEILKNINPNKQIIMTSATMNKKIEHVANKWLVCTGNNNNNMKSSNNNYYYRISIGQTGMASKNVQQHVLVLPNYEAKKIWLKQMLDTFYNIGRTIIFVSTRIDCESLKGYLEEKEHPSGSGASEDDRNNTNNHKQKIVTIHGDKHQIDRVNAIKSFTKSNSKTKVLIATDVASRGLDIPEIKTVINFDVAKNLDLHVHRIGRAGRLSTSTTKDNKKSIIRTEQQQHVDVEQEQESNQQQEQKQKQKQNKGTSYTLLTPKKDADFAHVLVNAFHRENIQVSTELQNLANTSKKAGGNTSSRNKWNKSGLGFNNNNNNNNDDGNASSYATSTTPMSTTTRDLMQNAKRYFHNPTTNNTNFATNTSSSSSGESSSKKRRRWG